MAAAAAIGTTVGERTFTCFALQIASFNPLQKGVERCSVRVRIATLLDWVVRVMRGANWGLHDVVVGVFVAPDPRQGGAVVPHIQLFLPRRGKTLES